MSVTQQKYNLYFTLLVTLIAFFGGTINAMHRQPRGDAQLADWHKDALPILRDGFQGQICDVSTNQWLSIREPDADIKACLKEPSKQSSALGRNVLHALCYVWPTEADVSSNPTQAHQKCHSLTQIINQYQTTYGSGTMSAVLQQYDNQGWTPLHCAVFRGLPSLVPCFLNIGADVTMLTDDGSRFGPESVLSIACTIPNEKPYKNRILCMLISALQNCNALENHEQGLKKNNLLHVQQLSAFMAARPPQTATYPYQQPLPFIMAPYPYQQLPPFMMAPYPYQQPPHYR